MTTWPDYANGGYIGLWLLAMSNTLLDNFNRSDGSIGTAWSGLTTSFAIASNRLKVLSKVLYNPVAQHVQVVTYDSSQGWVQQGANIMVTLTNGDRFGARALVDGIVEVYRNDTLLAMRDTSSWPDYASGGYVCLWLIGASNTLLDDFGGGTSSATTTAIITYTYDPLYRMTSATYSGSYTYTFAYSYDPVGNRTAQTSTITSTVVTTYTYDAANRLPKVGNTNYAWDNNGNLTNDGSSLYRYDQANRMISTTLSGATTLFNYNGDGVRLKQVVAGVPTTYTNDLAAPLPVVLQAKTSTTATQYLYNMGTRPVAQYTSSAFQYLLPDALGSVRQIADASGNILLTESYQPYGAVLTSTGSASSIFGYAGEQLDTAGLIYLRAHYMNPTLGIFTSRDPWGGDPMQPGSMNGFGYGLGNPVRHTDPSGHIEQDQVKDATAIIQQLQSAYKVTIPVDYSWYVIEDPEPGQSGNVWEKGAWQLNELQTVLEAVQNLANAMGSETKFQQNLGGVTVLRTDLGGLTGLTYIHWVALNSKTFTDLQNLRWTTTHELAHAWDANNNWQLSEQLEKYTGGTTSCVLGFLCCLGSTYIYGGIPSKGADINFTRQEDFAESVTTFLYPDVAQRFIATYYPGVVKFQYADYFKTPRARFVAKLFGLDLHDLNK